MLLQAMLSNASVDVENILTLLTVGGLKMENEIRR